MADLSSSSLFPPRSPSHSPSAPLATRSLSLYIHWPFCKAKCPYCDFNSYVRASIDEGAWQTALLREMDYWGELTLGRNLVSVFFGGGTPSLMPPRLVEALIGRAQHWWGFAPDVEITLEANPTSVEAEKLRDFRAAGVNRLSLGVQALNDADLHALGRQHSAQEAIRALALAEKLFPRFSFDLIYAREGQSFRAWEEELAHALTFGASHLSLYQLTIEENTRFARLHARGDLVLPDEILSSDLYDLTQSLTEAAGLPAYEISNHARNGEECRHNLATWRYHDYLGIGPGAHGRVTDDREKKATATHPAPEVWLQSVREKRHGLRDVSALAKEEQQIECLLMGLRLREGIPYARLAAFGASLSAENQRIKRLQKLGFLTASRERLQATDEGRLRLNALLGELAGELAGEF